MSTPHAAPAKADVAPGIVWAPAAILAYFAAQAASRVLAPGGLNLDEAEQMVAVQSLDWGYGAQPPLFTWAQIGVFQVTGEGELGLALFKNGLMAATVLGLWQLARTLGGDRRVALAASLGVVLLPATAWEAQNSQTHSVLALAMAVWAMLAAIRAERTGGYGAYAVLGLALGLGLLSKGTFAFLGLGIVVALALRGAGAARIGLALAVAAAIVARPAVWAVRNWGLTTVDAYKFKMQEGDGLGAVLDGLAALAQAIGAGAGLVVAAALALAVLRRPTEAPGPDARLVEWSLGIALAAVLALVLAAGGTEVKERWLQPLTILLPLVLACRLAPRLSPRVLRGFAVLAAVVALALLVGVGANMRLGGKNPPYQAAPFEQAAAAIEGDEILASDFYLAGNLRLVRPELEVKAPKMRLMPVAEAPSAAVWWARDDADRPMPDDLRALIEEAGLSAAAPKTSALPYPPPHEARVFHLYVAPLTGAGN